MRKRISLAAVLAVLVTCFIACPNDTPQGPCSSVAGGPGTPSLTFTHVPSLGSSDMLQGSAQHVISADNSVVVYIRVFGGYWVKPYFASPLTSINCDGTWSANIVTGGDDAEADQIVAFVVPSTYSPPLLSGESELPPELTQVALATATASR